MTLKDKIILIFLSIITFGIYPLVIFRKKEQAINSKLSTSNKITINIDKLKTLLGSSQNIVGSEYTHTKVKIFLKDTNLVNSEELQKLKGISGIFNTSKSTTIIVGNQAKAVAEKL